MGGINSMKQYQQYFGSTGLGKSTRWVSSLVVAVNGALIMARSTASCLEFSRCLSFYFLEELVCSNDSYHIVECIVVLSGQWPLSLIWSCRISDWYWDNSGSIPACKCEQVIWYQAILITFTVYQRISRTGSVVGFQCSSEISLWCMVLSRE